MFLSLKDLKVKAGNSQILKNFNFSLLPGAIFNFYGPNGIGKTRLLKTIAYCIEKGDSLVFQGRPKLVSDSTYISLDTNLYGSFTVRQNLQFMAKLHNNEVALLPAIHVFGLESYLDLQYQDLSTGWKRKVIFASLLFSTNPIWLIDEPFSSLDEDSKKRFEEIILSKASNGGIVLITNQERCENAEIYDFSLLPLANNASNSN